MQDRYLFRGKRTDNGEWVEGYLIIIAKVNYYIATGKLKTETIETAHIIPKIHKVNPETICQSTGLKDKNGKLIWENDIVFVTDKDGCTGGYDTGMGQIMFLKGLWYIDGTVQNGLYDTFDEGFNIEVIGNKFDNPELLEVQE